MNEKTTSKNYKVQLTLRLTSELLEFIQCTAQQGGISVNAYILILLNRELANQK